MRQSRPRPRLHDNFPLASPHSVRLNGHVCRQGNNTKQDLRLDVCNGGGPSNAWLIASADNSQVFWVLLAVCFVGSNLDSSDLWPVQLGASTFLLALYSTDYWFPFKMWRPSHSDHNLLINVSSSSSPAVVITTIREIEHSGTTLPGSSFLFSSLSHSVLFLFSRASSSCLLFFSHVCLCVCVFAVSWQGGR